jgi:tetratricopeptide (TPR) repeat protein
LLASPAEAALDLFEIKPRRVATCDALVREHPQELEAWRCYRAVWRFADQREAVEAALDHRHRLEPLDPWATLMLGSVEADRWSERAEPLLKEAADLFRRRGIAKEEGYARVQLFFTLAEQGRLDEAAAELDRAEEVAARAGEKRLEDLVLYHRGLEATARQAYVQALRIYRRVEARVFPDGWPILQRFVLNGLGNASFALGLFRESADAFRRAAELARASADYHGEADERANMVAAAAELAGEGGTSADELRRLAGQAREVARRAGNRRAEAGLLVSLSEDTSQPPPARVLAAEEALRLGRSGLLFNATGAALQALVLASLDAGEDGSRVRALVKEALRHARSGGELAPGVQALSLEARVERRLGGLEAAIEAGGSAIDAVERIRDLQRDDLARARFLGRWAGLYRGLAEDLLASPVPSYEQIDRAFQVAERLRARTLLEALDVAGATAHALGQGPLLAQRTQVLAEIALLQRRLLASRAGATRAAALGELERLERQEAELREEIARQDPEFAFLHRPSCPSLREVQDSLAPDEAILSYLAGEDAVIAFAISREAAHAFRLYGAPGLGALVAQFLGLLEWRDGSEARAAARLFRDLVAEPLLALPAGVRRLVFLPDGVLHRMPFEALRPTPEAAPLGTRYSVSAAPSAAVWLRLRRQGERPFASAALSLADPVLEGAPGPVPMRQAAPWDEPLRLGSLPHARREGRTVSGELTPSVLRVGTEASERYVKQAPLSGFRLLHFAAHAVTDDERPERSAVLLVPGAGDEDGLLQTREIVGLDLQGVVVVLSACRTASGAVLSGEGVMGLARAFMQAGSRAVVGSLWPLRDEEASALVQAFVRALARGQSLGEALTAARRERHAAGAPTAAWAGLVVIGDAGYTPFPGGVRSARPRRIALAGGLVLVLLAVFVGLRRRRPVG